MKNKDVRVMTKIRILVQILQSIPTCDNLPSTSDDSSCINLDQTVSIRQNGK